MKHSLQLRLSQHLTLTPQLQQSIRLLQLRRWSSTRSWSASCRKIRCSSATTACASRLCPRALPPAADAAPATDAPAADAPPAEGARRRGRDHRFPAARRRAALGLPRRGRRRASTQQVAADTPDAARASHRRSSRSPSCPERDRRLVTPAHRLARRRRLSHAEPRGARRVPARRSSRSSPKSCRSR